MDFLSISEFGHKENASLSHRDQAMEEKRHLIRSSQLHRVKQSGHHAGEHGGSGPVWAGAGAESSHGFSNTRLSVCEAEGERKRGRESEQNGVSF